MQRFFGRGHVMLHGDAALYQVVKLSDLAFIIEHFDNYPLKTQKYGDFILFKQAFHIVKIKEHLTKEGLSRLINIRATLNKGLPPRLSGGVFTNVIPVPRPEIPPEKTLKAGRDCNAPEIKH